MDKTTTSIHEMSHDQFIQEMRQIRQNVGLTTWESVQVADQMRLNAESEQAFKQFNADNDTNGIIITIMQEDLRAAEFIHNIAPDYHDHEQKRYHQTQTLLEPYWNAQFPTMGPLPWFKLPLPVYIEPFNIYEDFWNCLFSDTKQAFSTCNNLLDNILHHCKYRDVRAIEHLDQYQILHFNLSARCTHSKYIDAMVQIIMDKLSEVHLDWVLLDSSYIYKRQN